MDRLAYLGGVFGSEPFLFVLLQAAKLVLGDVASILSWITGRVLIAQCGVPQAFFNSLHLKKKLYWQVNSRQLFDKFYFEIMIWPNFSVP